MILVPKVEIQAKQRSTICISDLRCTLPRVSHRVACRSGLSYIQYQPCWPPKGVERWTVRRVAYTVILCDSTIVAFSFSHFPVEVWALADFGHRHHVKSLCLPTLPLTMRLGHGTVSWPHYPRRSCRADSVLGFRGRG